MSVVALQPHGSRTPLFLVHGIGGEVAHSFRHVVSHFPADQPLYGLEACRLFNSIEEMGADYTRAIKSVQPDGPYQVGGYSFGASAALEICQCLLRGGDEVRSLLVFDHVPGPTRYEPNQWTSGTTCDAMANLARWFVASFGQKHNIAWSWERVGQRLRLALGSDSSAATKTDADYVFKVDRLAEQIRLYIENHYRILRNYDPQPYDGRVVLFRSAVRPLFRTYPPTLGWERLVARHLLRVVPVPGDHVSMLRGKRAPIFASKINKHLAGAAEASAPAILSTNPERVFEAPRGAGDLVVALAGGA